MTDEELREIMADTARRMDERDKLTRQQFRERDARMDAMFRERDARMDEMFREHDRQMKLMFAEQDKRWERMEREFVERDRHLQREHGKQDKSWERMKQEFTERDKRRDQRLSELDQRIGYVDNKPGSFTEGLAEPSITRLLRNEFHCTFVMPNVCAQKGGENLELDALGYSNGSRNEAYIVEIKSHAKDDSIEQLLRQLENFPRFFPAYRNKKLFGVLVGVRFTKDVASRALKKGLFVVRVSGDVFELQVPQGFRPHSFQQKAA